MAKIDIKELAEKSAPKMTKGFTELLKQHSLLDGIIGPLDKCTKGIILEMSASLKHLKGHELIFNQNLISPYYKSLESVHAASESIIKSFKLVSDQISAANYKSVSKFATIMPPKDVVAFADVMKTSLTQYADIALQADKSATRLLANSFINNPAVDSVLGLQIDFQKKYGQLNEIILTKDISKSFNPISITQFTSTELLLNNRFFENTFIPNVLAFSVDSETTTHIKKKSNDVISEKLSKLSPSLLKTLNGAREAIYSKNEDRYRHVSASYRELLKKIIFKLAPIEEVRKWATNPKDFRKNSTKTPTYDACLRYLAKDINPKEFGDFYIIDNKLITAQIRLLDDLDHSDDPSKKNIDLESLSLRVEHYIAFLLQFAH